MKPEEVFRFLNVRPVQQAPDNHVSRGFATYNKDAKSPFHQEIERLEGEGSREKAIELARKKLATNEPVNQELLTLLDASMRSENQSRDGSLIPASSNVGERSNQFTDFT